MEEVHLYLEAAIGDDEDRENLLDEIIPLLGKFSLPQLRLFNDSLQTRINSAGSDLPRDEYSDTVSHQTLERTLKGADPEKIEEFRFFFSIANRLDTETLDHAVGDAQAVLKNVTSSPDYNGFMKERIEVLKSQGLNRKDAYRDAYLEWQEKKDTGPLVYPRATLRPTIHQPTVRPVTVQPTIGASVDPSSFTGPDAYQNFLKTRIPQLKGEGLNRLEAFSTAVMEWKEAKM